MSEFIIGPIPLFFSFFCCCFFLNRITITIITTMNNKNPAPPHARAIISWVDKFSIKDIMSPEFEAGAGAFTWLPGSSCGWSTPKFNQKQWAQQISINKITSNRCPTPLIITTTNGLNLNTGRAHLSPISAIVAIHTGSRSTVHGVTVHWHTFVEKWLYNQKSRNLPGCWGIWFCIWGTWLETCGCWGANICWNWLNMPCCPCGAWYCGGAGWLAILASRLRSSTMAGSSHCEPVAATCEPPPPPPPLAADLFRAIGFLALDFSFAWAAFTFSASMTKPPFLSVLRNWAYFWTLTGPVTSFGFFFLGGPPFFALLGLKNES